jgi:hypothetical protein
MSGTKKNNVNVFNPEGITPSQAGFLGTLLGTKVYEVDFGYIVEEFDTEEVLTFGEILESYNPEGIRVNGVAGSTYELFELMTMEEAKPFISWLCQCEDKPKPATSGGWKGKRKNSAPAAPQPKGSTPAKPVAPAAPAKPEASLEEIVAKAVAAALQQMMAPAEPVVEAPQPTAGHEMLTVENGMAVKLPNGTVVQLVLGENDTLRSRKNFVPVS